jgi:holin-like protein
MIRGFAVLLLCQLAGEAITRGLGLPVPGPVLGLAFLVAGLAVRKRFYPLEDPMPATSDVGRVADGLLGALALLYFGLIGAYGLALGLALVGSTLATLLATVGTFLLVKRVVEARQ